jgi:hypothetical protein
MPRRLSFYQVLAYKTGVIIRHNKCHFACALFLHRGVSPPSMWATRKSYEHEETSSAPHRNSRPTIMAQRGSGVLTLLRLSALRVRSAIWETRREYHPIHRAIPAAKRFVRSRRRTASRSFACLHMMFVQGSCAPTALKGTARAPMHLRARLPLCQGA